MELFEGNFFKEKEKKMTKMFVNFDLLLLSISPKFQVVVLCTRRTVTFVAVVV